MYCSEAGTTVDAFFSCGRWENTLYRLELFAERKVNLNNYCKNQAEKQLELQKSAKHRWGDTKNQNWGRKVLLGPTVDTKCGKLLGKIIWSDSLLNSRLLKNATEDEDQYGSTAWVFWEHRKGVGNSRTDDKSLSGRPTWRQFRNDR